MPIDDKVYFAPAVKGDVAGAAITASIALRHIADAIEAISAGRPTAEHVANIRSSADKLSTIFDDLTGYKP